jgi:hypothetical protein
MQTARAKVGVGRIDRVLGGMVFTAHGIGARPDPHNNVRLPTGHPHTESGKPSLLPQLSRHPEEDG